MDAADNIESLKVKLAVQPSQVKDCATILLHAIFLCRTFKGPVKPTDAEAEFLEFNYVVCDEEDVKQAVDEVCSKLKQQTRLVMPGDKISVALQFYTTRKKGFLGEDRLVFEEFLLEFTIKEVNSEDQRMEFTKGLQQDLRLQIERLINFINQKQGHLPELDQTTKSAVAFRYDLKVL
eukprot:Clim_evm81s243 gene=Clim_evmTU81s243